VTRTRRTPATERQMRDRGVYDVDAFDAWLAERGWGWGALERGAYPLSLEEALVAFTLVDPVRWCETYLIEPDGSPYAFFDYQRESVRAWRQDVVHEDAAEVGKTREIVALLLWGHVTGFGCTKSNPSTLVAAPQQIFLNEIIDAIERQVGVFKSMPGESVLKQAWLEPRRTPHTQLRFRCLNAARPDKPTLATIDFRPAGHDGEAFRGVHVTALALVDEAAKMKAKVQWTEFYRAMMPGCHMRAYSVPDGDRNTEFYRLCAEGVLGLQEDAKGFRKFHWPKSVMPAPFWSAERDAHFVKLYGGRDTPGYQRNVLGLWGDAEDPVFRWDQLLPNVVDLPDYRRLQIAADGKADVLYLDVARIDLVLNEGQKSGRVAQLVDSAVDLSPFIGKDDEARRTHWDELLSPWLAHIDPRGVFWAGADLGERNDPTEIIVSEEVGGELRDVLRIKAKGMPYHAQSELIYQVDRIFGHRAGWGIDLGSAGTAVVKDLLNLDRFASANFEDRLIGFHFQEAVDCTGEDGESLTVDADDGSQTILRAPAKHWATQCIVARLQQRGYRIAYDGDVLNDYTSHTARAGAKWPIYGKTNDHTIDARRQQMLRKLRAVEATDPDVFSVGTFDRRAA
jgi:hypothetical protein